MTKSIPKTKILKKIFVMQLELDNCFKSKPDILLAYSFDKKLIAFFVEFCEFLNEIEIFKYWKLNKKQNNSDKVLEEFVDGLHFLASAGLELNFYPPIFKWESQESDNIALIKETIFIYNKFLQGQHSQRLYNRLVVHFFWIIINLGFSDEEVLKAFEAKNKLNFNRVNGNY